MTKRLTILAASLAIAAATACAHDTRTTTAGRGERLTGEKSRAAALIADGDYDGAVSVLEPLSKEASGDPQVFVMLGDAYSRLDRFDDAVAAYESAMRLAYSSPDAHLKLATLLMQHGRTGRALTEFELAIRYGDRQPLTHYNYGLALRERGQNDAALTEFKRAHEMAPDDPRYAEAVGIGLTGVDDGAAVEAFDDAARLGATGASFHNNYGLALGRLGRVDEAAAQYDAAIAADPDDEEYRFNRAALLSNAGRHEAAAAAWEAMIDAYGPRWSYRVYLAGARQALGDDAGAIAVLEEPALAFAAGTLDSALVDRVPPTLSEAFATLALAHRGLGEGAEAVDFMRRAVDKEPANTVYRNNYGVMLAENGMLAQARSQWRRVLEGDADNAQARANLERFGP